MGTFFSGQRYASSPQQPLIECEAFKWFELVPVFRDLHQQRVDFVLLFSDPFFMKTFVIYFLSVALRNKSRKFTRHV